MNTTSNYSDKLKRSLASISLFCSSVIVTNAQSPGDIGTTNLTGWWKSSSLAIGNINTWGSTFPNGAAAIDVADNWAPYPICTNTPTQSIFNYNSVIDFNGNSSATPKMLTNTNAINLLTNNDATGQGTLFAVYARPTQGNLNDGFVSYRNGLDGVQLRGWGRIAIGSVNATSGTRNFAMQAEHQQTIVSYTGNKSSATSMLAYKNGDEIINTSASSSTGDNALTFGARYIVGGGSYTEHFSGYLSEVIFYNTDLSAADINKIHTYLAVKYGITLVNTGGGTQGDYISTSGSIVWDASLSPVYHNDVIGIARDDNEVLLQKQSHSFDDSLRIYIDALSANNDANAGSLAANGSYVMLGHNAGSLCSTTASLTEMPTGLSNCTLYSRLEREWKITNTNFNQSYNLDITLNNCAQPLSVNTAELRVLIDDDGDFSNGGTSCYYNGDGSGIVISYNGPTVTIENISNTHMAANGTAYLTVASIAVTTPLPIELLAFDALLNTKDQVDLLWTTSSEKNNANFIIERSKNLTDWEFVTSVPGAINSSTLLSYKTIDPSPLSGISYYRLGQNDLDGTTTYAEIESIHRDNSIDQITIYPNPSNGSFVLLGANVNKEDLHIYNMIGQDVRYSIVPMDSDSYLIELNNASAGVYMLKYDKEIFKLIVE